MEFRTGKQCRERYMNQLDPKNKKSPWSDEEDATIIKLHNRYGNKWKSFVVYLPGRSDNAVKNRYHLLTKQNGETSMDFNDDDPTVNPYLPSGILPTMHVPINKKMANLPPNPDGTAEDDALHGSFEFDGGLGVEQGIDVDPECSLEDDSFSESDDRHHKIPMYFASCTDSCNAKTSSAIQQENVFMGTLALGHGHQNTDRTKFLNVEGSDIPRIHVPFVVPISGLNTTSTISIAHIKAAALTAAEAAASAVKSATTTGEFVNQAEKKIVLATPVHAVMSLADIKAAAQLAHAGGLAALLTGELMEPYVDDLISEFWDFDPTDDLTFADSLLDSFDFPLPAAPLSNIPLIPLTAIPALMEGKISRVPVAALPLTAIPALLAGKIPGLPLAVLPAGVIPGVSIPLVIALKTRGTLRKREASFDESSSDMV